jgi:hypothetical protein
MSAQITHVDPEETIRKLKAKVARLEKALAAQAAPVQTVAIPDNVRKIAKSMQKDGYRGPLSWARTVIDFVATYKSPPAAQPAPVHPDSARIDWLTNNPLDALDIFGQVKGSDAVRWIRQEIDNAMLKKDGATHD